MSTTENKKFVEVAGDESLCWLEVWRREGKKAALKLWLPCTDQKVKVEVTKWGRKKANKVESESGNQEEKILEAAAAGSIMPHNWKSAAVAVCFVISSQWVLDNISLADIYKLSNRVVKCQVTVSDAERVNRIQPNCLNGEIVVEVLVMSKLLMKSKTEV